MSVIDLCDECMSVIDLCNDGADSDDEDVNVGVAVELLDVVVQPAAVGGGGAGVDTQRPKQVSGWPLDVVVQTSVGGGSEGADTQPPKKLRGRPRKSPKTSRFGEVAGALFTATSTEIYFEVAGKPSPKKRAAYGRNSNRYNPSKVDEQDFAEVVKGLCHRYHVQSVPKFAHDVLLAMHIVFYFPCKTDGSSSLCNEADIDNLCKFVLDALNDVLYADDRQIIELTATKCFDTAACLIGRTIVTITKKI